MKTLIVLLALFACAFAIDFNTATEGEMLEYFQLSTAVVKNYTMEHPEEFASSCSSSCASKSCTQLKQPTYNGCGAANGISKLTPDYPFLKCCNNHDVSYGLCKAQKSSCDSNFLSCMKGICKGVAKIPGVNMACNALADVYHAAVSSSSTACTAFKNAQNTWVKYSGCKY